jgi:hypothetical protein
MGRETGVPEGCRKGRQARLTDHRNIEEISLNEFIWLMCLVGIVIGLPVLCGVLISVASIIRSWHIKSRELKLEEKKLLIDEKLRAEEMNARILNMDSGAVSAAAMAELADQVRQLREEVAELRRQGASQTTNQ